MVFFSQYFVEQNTFDLERLFTSKTFEKVKYVRHFLQLFLLMLNSFYELLIVCGVCVYLCVC